MALTLRLSGLLPSSKLTLSAKMPPFHASTCCRGFAAKDKASASAEQKPRKKTAVERFEELEFADKFRKFGLEPAVETPENANDLVRRPAPRQV
jgi:hypothetical protein